MSTGGPTVTTYTPPAGLRAIISGVGGVREHLAETLRAQGVRRPMILCGRNVGATPLVQVVAAAAGMDCAIFTGSQEHTPISAVDSGRDAARDCGADALIALGGVDDQRWFRLSISRKRSSHRHTVLHGSAQEPGSSVRPYSRTSYRLVSVY